MFGKAISGCLVAAIALCLLSCSRPSGPAGAATAAENQPYRIRPSDPPPTRLEPGMAGFFPTLSPGWLDWDRRFMEEEQKTCRSLADYFSAEPVEGPAVEAVPYRPRIPCRS